MAEDASKTPLVSVVVPTRNRKNTVARCVDSILGSSNARLEVIVVDDASSDGTLAHLSKLFPNIMLLRNRENRLVSYSRNIGCKHAKGDFVFLMDDDNVVHSDAIAELVKAVSSDPHIGIAGPIMYYLSDPMRVWYSGVSWNSLTSTSKFCTSRPNRSAECYPTNDIPNAFMVRKTMFDEVGFFDEVVFPQHCEEADLCRRATEKGYRVIMVPKATIWHDVPVRNWPYRSVRDLHMTSIARAYYVARNRILFMRKYAGPGRFVVFAQVFLPTISLAHIIIIFKETGLGSGRTAFAWSYLRGLIDGINLKIHDS